MVSSPSYTSAPFFWEMVPCRYCATTYVAISPSVGCLKRSATAAFKAASSGYGNFRVHINTSMTARSMLISGYRPRLCFKPVIRR